MHGKLLLLEGGDPFPFPQDCFCIPADERIHPYEGLDLSTHLELCRCCAFEPIRTRSRWSSFYCDSCRSGVLDANRAFGAWVIPIGRHSIMHSVSLSAGAEDDAGAVEQFVTQVRGLLEGIQHLDAWAAGQTRLHLATLGLDGDDLPLADFLRAARAHPLDKQAALDGLLRHFVDGG